MRIALLGYRSNPYSGGQGVYLKYLSRALAGLGHSVDVISGEPYPDLDPAVRLVRLPGLNLYAHFPNHIRALRARHLRSFTDTFEWWSMATGGFPEPYTFGRRLLRHIRSLPFRYDVIHDNQSLCSALPRLAAEGQTLVATVHHPIQRDRDIALAHARDWRARLLIRRWYHFIRMQERVARQLPNLVTVSDCSRQDIARAFALDPQRIQVVHNGIDTEAFAPRTDVARKPRQLMTVASADQPLKGTQHLIPALAGLSGRFPDIELIFVGQPKPGGATDRLIDRLNVRGRIRFVHGIDSAELRRLYAESTIAVVPSEYEGFGLPAGEAMACGIPLVSSDGGALPEVVGDAGVIVPAGQPDALARAIGQLLEDPARREQLGAAGRARILERFCWTKAAQALTQIYARVRQ